MKTVLSAILLSFSLQASAMLFEWSGNCVINCSGIAHAVFTVRDDYVPGTTYLCGFTYAPPGTVCPITNVVYFDNTRTTHFNYTLPEYITGTGRFPASPSDPGFSHIGFWIGDTFDFPFWSSLTDVDHWGVYGEDPIPHFREFLSQGTGGRFSLAIPEPSTLLLLGAYYLVVRQRRRVGIQQS